MWNFYDFFAGLNHPRPLYYLFFFFFVGPRADLFECNNGSIDKPVDPAITKASF